MVLKILVFIAGVAALVIVVLTIAGGGKSSAPAAASAPQTASGTPATIGYLVQ
jgi:hypothetical protein